MLLRVGDTLPGIVSPPGDRLRIAYMAVAMRDPNLVHVEDSYAQRSGLPGVIAHGTFAFSYAGAAVARVAGVDALRRLEVALTAPVFAGDVLRTTGVATALDTEAEGVELVTVELTVERQDGVRVAQGAATFAQSGT